MVFNSFFPNILQVNISAIVETIDLSGDDSWSSVYEQTMDLKFVLAVVYLAFASLSLIIMFPMNIYYSQISRQPFKGFAAARSYPFGDNDASPAHRSRYILYSHNITNTIVFYCNCLRYVIFRDGCPRPATSFKQ